MRTLSETIRLEDRHTRSYYKYAFFVLVFTCTIFFYVLPRILSEVPKGAFVYSLISIIYILTTALLLSAFLSPYRVIIDVHTGEVSVQYMFGLTRTVLLGDLVALKWARSMILREARLKIVSSKSTWTIRTVPNADYMKWKEIVSSEVHTQGGSLFVGEAPAVDAERIAARGFRLTLPSGPEETAAGCV